MEPFSKSAPACSSLRSFLAALAASTFACRSLSSAESFGARCIEARPPSTCLRPVAIFMRPPTAIKSSVTSTSASALLVVPTSTWREVRHSSASAALPTTAARAARAEPATGAGAGCGTETDTGAGAGVGAGAAGSGTAWLATTERGLDDERMTAGATATTGVGGSCTSSSSSMTDTRKYGS